MRCLHFCLATGNLPHPELLVVFIDQVFSCFIVHCPFGFDDCHVKYITLVNTKPSNKRYPRHENVFTILSPSTQSNAPHNL